MERQHILGCGIVLGTVFVVTLIAVGGMHHPESIEGPGSGLLRMDIALLSAYGITGIVAWKQKAGNANTSASAGAKIGLLLGAVQIANHLIEAFVPVRPFIL